MHHLDLHTHNAGKIFDLVLAAVTAGLAYFVEHPNSVAVMLAAVLTFLRIVVIIKNDLIPDSWKQFISKINPLLMLVGGSGIVLALLMLS